MAVLGSVFDEEDVGDVRNAPTLTLLRAKLVEIRVLVLTRPIVTHECRLSQSTIPTVRIRHGWVY